tara:strand:- start:3938 stop:4057 length:120 start_codon:yes stop_codon:yes gene_type:complete
MSFNGFEIRAPHRGTFTFLFYNIKKQKIIYFLNFSIEKF